MFVLYFILIARSIIRSPTTTRSIGTISNPRTDLSNPRTDLPNPSTDLSHTSLLNNEGKVTTIGDLIEEVYDNTDKEIEVNIKCNSNRESHIEM